MICNKKFVLLALLIFIALLISVISAIYWQDGTKTAGKFTQSEIALRVYDLWDLGVAKANDDVFLDVYTLNHSARQSLLVGDGLGTFTDKLSAMNLDQDHGVVELEDSAASPELVNPGLYIFRQKRWLTIRAIDTSTFGDISGHVVVPWRLSVKAKGDAHYEQREVNQGSNGGVLTEIDFSISNAGSIRLNGHDDIVELPHSIDIASSFPLERVYLGASLKSPVDHKFTLMWRDRHSMSWADYNGDHNIDLFVGRGGVKGRIDLVPATIKDELFLGSGESFEDQIDESGMVKDLCPVRQSAWVDFDSDGDLDLYISCGKEAGEKEYPNQLFRQNPQGKFTNVAAEFGLDYPYISVFRWIDVDNDSDMDLLAIEKNAIRLYRNEAGHFDITEVAESLAENYVKIAVADYDNDGDLDAYALSRAESVLIKNDRGALSLVDPSSVGLPAGGRTANWTDFDNDGLVDLHVVPSGIFRQRKDHTFESTSLLKERTPAARVSSARCAWFDLDSNGSRDALCAVEKYPVKPVRIAKKLFDRNKDTRYWKANIYRNGIIENNWLQVDLVGPPENRQAIGARVYVSTDDVEQFQQVGATEDAHYSQGHYRLYFGLAQSQVQAMQIVWPDGRIEEISGIEGNRLMVVNGDR